MKNKPYILLFVFFWDICISHELTAANIHENNTPVYFSFLTGFMGDKDQEVTMLLNKEIEFNGYIISHPNKNIAANYTTFVDGATFSLELYTTDAKTIEFKTKKIHNSIIDTTKGTYLGVHFIDNNNVKLVQQKTPIYEFPQQKIKKEQYPYMTSATLYEYKFYFMGHFQDKTSKFNSIYIDGIPIFQGYLNEFLQHSLSGIFLYHSHNDSISVDYFVQDDKTAKILSHGSQIIQHKNGKYLYVRHDNEKPLGIIKSLQKKKAAGIY